MRATPREIRHSLSKYRKHGLAINEYITLGAHVSASLKADLNISTRWAVPSLAFNREWAKQPLNAAASQCSTFLSVCGLPSLSSQHYDFTHTTLQVQGKVDGRRVLAPIWAELNTAGFGRGDKGVCVQVWS
jgi:hypothetical protein